MENKLISHPLPRKVKVKVIDLASMTTNNSHNVYKCSYQDIELNILNLK